MLLMVGVSVWQNLLLRFLFSVMLNLTQFGFTYGSVLMAFKSCYKTVVKLQIFVRADRNVLSLKKKNFRSSVLSFACLTS